MERIHEHGDLLDIRNRRVKRLLASARALPESTSILIGRLPRIAGRLQDVRCLNAADRYEITVTKILEE